MRRARVPLPQVAAMKVKDRNRWDRLGRVRWLAQSGPWCMVRRRGAMPFVMATAEFLALSQRQLDANGDQAHGSGSDSTGASEP